MPLSYTPTLHLGKPALSDPALIGDLNTNADLIDAASARVFNVKGSPYLATGDGTTNDGPAILAAEAAMGASGGTLYFPPGTYRLAFTTTLLPTTQLQLAPGAVLAPATGAVLTIQGTVQAGLWKVFQTGGGTVAFSRAQPVYPEWWGALADVKSGQTTGAITSASATLTVASGPFVATDVGKIAVVLGAGAAGAPLVTTVAAYVSASQVTLAANASTTVTASRWAIGSDSTTAVNACLAAAGGTCPVTLSGLYGVATVLLAAGQMLAGRSMETTGFYRLATGTGGATVSLAPGVSGDSLRLESFLVNAMFVGTADGLEIGTSAGALALASGGYLRHVKVRNASGWGVNVRCNVAFVENVWAQHDQAPPTGNTTAGGIRLIDTLVYADALTVECYCPAGAFVLAASGGSVYNGLQMELSGSYALVDAVTVSGTQSVLKGVYATLGTHRDLIRIASGTREVSVEMIRLAGSYTLTNVLNDVDRVATIPSTGADQAVLGYWTAASLTFAGQLGLVDQTAWTPFTPTWGGFSTPPTVTSRYKQIGKTVIWAVTVTSNGTSSGTTLTATLPVNARAAQVGAAFGVGVDNGAFLATPVRVDVAGATTAQFYTTPAAGVWTGTATGKSVSFSLCYEAA